MLFIASFSTYNTIYNIKRRVVSGGYLFGFVRTVYTTPRIIITTTTHNKKHKRFVFIRELKEEKKETNLHKRLLLALDVLSSCILFHPYIMWHVLFYRVFEYNDHIHYHVSIGYYFKIVINIYLLDIDSSYLQDVYFATSKNY